MTKRPAKAETSAGRRVLLLSHSHPKLTRGGAEMAAVALQAGLNAQPGWQAFLVGATMDPGGARVGSPITQPFGDDDYLYTVGAFGWFNFANRDRNFPRAFAEMLEEVRPDVLHFHHYLSFGVDTFDLVRRILPDAKIVLTLHEFQAICNHYGQMIKSDGHTLCREATPRDCNRCFSQFSRADFFLRQLYIQRFFDLVDQFIAPSQFLADRYIAWGVPTAKMRVLENVIASPAASAAVAREDKLFRVGFFGQVSRLKGINVLLDAAARLAEEKSAVTFDIHGDDSNQPDEFRADFAKRRTTAAHNVRFHGAYDNSRVDALMRNVDVVVVPSIWWENSPIVIQEALRNGKPIICSDIGGMAEKVRPGLDGWHIPVGDAPALADLLSRLATDRKALAAMGKTLRTAATPADGVAAHLALYDGLFSRP